MGPFHFQSTQITKGKKMESGCGMTKRGTRKRTRNAFRLDGVFWQDVVTFHEGDKLPARVLCPPERGRGATVCWSQIPPHRHAFGYAPIIYIAVL